MPQVRFAFFGTPRFGEIVLDELRKGDMTPALIVTAPDKPKGRGLTLSPSEVKQWGVRNGIPVVTPSSLNDEAFIRALCDQHCDLFVVAAYGKIIPKAILELPKHGTLNVHPSLLPKFRGASPVESVILSDEQETGVTIIALDEEMDHGPILAARKYETNDWPPRGSTLTEALAHLGGALLAETIPRWIGGELTATPQDHACATFTKKIVKDDGLIDLSGDPLTNYKKIRALDEWPGAFFFTERGGKRIRVRIVDAKLENGALTITRIIPEGKKEMSYDDFLRGGRASP